VKHLSDAPPGRLLALPTNIRLSWKGMPGTKSLYHFKKTCKLQMQKVLNIWLRPGWFGLGPMI
jgi:hypothetical protein